MIALLARTFVVGLAVAIPVGAMGCLCIERTLTQGWRHGMATGAGIATADGVYAATAAFGITAVTTLLVSSQTTLRLVGGGVLLAIGLRTALSRTPQNCGVDTGSGGLMRQYASAVALTLTNPMTIIAFAGVLLGAGLVAGSGVEAAVAVLGVASGSLFWWFVLVTAVARMRRSMKPRHLALVGQASGLLVAVFGMIVIAGVLR